MHIVCCISHSKACCSHICLDFSHRVKARFHKHPARTTCSDSTYTRVREYCRKSDANKQHGLTGGVPFTFHMVCGTCADGREQAGGNCWDRLDSWLRCTRACACVYPPTQQYNTITLPQPMDRGLLSQALVVSFFVCVCVCVCVCVVLFASQCRF